MNFFVLFYYYDYYYTQPTTCHTLCTTRYILHLLVMYYDSVPHTCTMAAMASSSSGHEGPAGLMGVSIVALASVLHMHEIADSTSADELAEGLMVMLDRRTSEQ